MARLRIVRRRRWGGVEADSIRVDLPWPNTDVHHTADGGPAGWADATPDQEAAYLRSVELFHIETRGMLAIAYNFIIMPSGRAYEGRGWRAIGAHTYNEVTKHDYNPDTLGICLAGNFMAKKPTDASLDTLARLIRKGLRRRPGRAFRRFIQKGIHPKWGHRDVDATACPGGRLYSKLDEVREAVRR